MVKAKENAQSYIKTVDTGGKSLEVLIAEERRAPAAGFWCRRMGCRCRGSHHDPPTHRPLGHARGMLLLGSLLRA